jgi:hydroxypyruvate isomerase
MSKLPPLRFSVCVEMIFNHMPFEQRLEYVSSNGFSAFEFWRRSNKDMNITQALRMALRLSVAAFVGSDASLVDESQHPKFLEDIARSAALAVDLDCSNLIVVSGNTLPDVPLEQQHDNIVMALRKAAETAADAGVTLVLEPLNDLVDHPGCYLTSSAEGFQIIEEVHSPHVKLLYDIYHQQISEGNLTKTISDNIDLIGHFHVADVPGRHEPGTGEINYEHIFGLLRESNYRGYVGLEFTPLVDAEASLRAIRAMAS